MYGHCSKYCDGQVITQLRVELSLDEILVKIGRAADKPAFKIIAQKTLDSARAIWAPKLTYRWLTCLKKEKNELQLSCLSSGQKVVVDLGFAIQFVEGAEKALVGVYTVGHELEELAKSVSESGLHLESYIYNIISLGVLEKVNGQINTLVESYAALRGWGVSPFLSPGSVHGWKLEEQLSLIKFLPISEIGVEKSSLGILHPFNSLSFLIAVGPGLKERKVGTSCQVCSRRENCEMQGQL